MGEKRLPYKAAIFDLDGTLLNTLEDLADSLNHVLTEAKMPMRTMDEVCRFVGNGIHKLIERAVPEGTAAETIEQLYQEFLKWYQFHCAEKTRPYEGIEALLKELKTKGVQTAVLSNKADGAVKSLCETYFPGMLQAEAGDRAGIKKKPAPDGVFEILQQLQVMPEEVMYIGDSDVDIETAKNAGIGCISVTWGFRTREFLVAHGAKLLVDRPEDIEKIFF